MMLLGGAGPATHRWAPMGRVGPNVLRVVLLTGLLAGLVPLPAAATDVALILSPAVGPPTTVTVATGEGFASGERVVLGFDRRTLETVRAAPDGTFAQEVQVPATASPGDHTMSARGALSGEATATFTVRTDWPTARFVPEGTGHNPYENVLSPANVGDLELAWSVQTEGSLFSTPIVVEGVVYVAGHVGVTDGAGLYAYDAATGQEIWTRRDGGQPPSDLVVADGKLYVSFLNDHILRAYDASTGELLWEVPGPTQSPTVVDGVVYAADHLRSLWAIDAQTGRKIWVAHAPLGGYGFGLAVADRTVYVGGSDLDGTSPIYAYNASTGALMWRTETGGAVDPTPAVANGMVYASSGDQLFYALVAGTGRVRWTADIGGLETSSPAVGNGVVYLGSTNGNVYAFDAKIGEQLWIAPTAGIIDDTRAAIVSNGVVYIGSGDEVFAFDGATGERLWFYEMGGAAREQSVVDGTLYVTSFDDHLYAFRLPGG